MAISFDEGAGAVSTRMVNTPGGMREVKEYSGSATTTGGIATFQLTDTGLNSGTPIFKNIITVSPTAMLNATYPAAVPRCSARALSADRKVLTIQAAQGGPALTVVGFNVAGVETWVPDGTRVYLTVVGE